MAKFVPRHTKISIDRSLDTLDIDTLVGSIATRIAQGRRIDAIHLVVRELDLRRLNAILGGLVTIESAYAGRIPDVVAEFVDQIQSEALENAHNVLEDSAFTQIKEALGTNT